MSFRKPRNGRQNPDRGARSSSRGDTPGRTTWRRRVRTALVVVFTGIALLVLLFQTLRVPSVSTWLANVALRQLAPLPRAKVSVGKVRTTGAMHLEVRDLRMTRGDTVLVVVRELDVDPYPWALLAGRVQCNRIAIDGLQVSPAFAAGAPGASESPVRTPAAMLRGAFYEGPPLHVKRLDLRDGSYGMPGADKELDVTGVTLVARDVELGDAFGFIVDSLALRYTPSGLDQEAIALDLAAKLEAGHLDIGRLRVGGRTSDVKGNASLVLGSRDSTQTVAVEMQADSLDLADLRIFVPGRDLAGRVSLDIALHGPEMRRLSGTVRVGITECRVGSSFFGPGHLLADFADGRATIEMAGSWDGMRVDIGGWAQPLSDLPHYELTLQLDGLPRRLPGAPAWAAFARRESPSANLHVQGDGYADASLEVEGTLTSGMARMALRGSLRLQPDLEWEVPHLAVENVDLARWLGDSTASRINGTFTAQGHGSSADSLHLELAWDVTACRYGEWELHSSQGAFRMQGRDLAAQLDLDMAAGRVAVDSVTARLGDDGHFAIPSLRFTAVDLAQIAHRPELRSDLSGTLRVDGVTASRPAATDAPAWRRLDATGRLTLEPSRFGDRNIDVAKAELRFHQETLHAVVQMLTDAGRIHLRAEAKPFAIPAEYEIEELRFAEWNVGAWTSERLTSRLNGSLTGKASILPATTRPARDSRVSASATLRLETSQVESLTVVGAVVAGTMSDGELKARGTLRTSAGAMGLAGHASFGEHGARGQASLDVPFGVLAALAGRDTAQADGQLRVATRFDALGRATKTLEIELDGRGRVGDWSVDSLFARTRLADGTLGIDTLEVQSNAFHAVAAGRWVYADSSESAPSDLRVRVRSRDVSALRAFLGADTLALAEGQMEAHLTGRAAARTFTLRTSLASLVWNDWELLGAHAEAQGVIQRDGRPLRGTATAEIDRLRSSRVHLDKAGVRGNYENEELHATVDVFLDEAHQLFLAATASRDSAGSRVDLREARIQAEEKRWQLVQPARLYVGNQRLHLDSLEIRSDGAFVLAQGTLDRRGEQDFRVEAKHFGLDIFTSWLERHDLGGTLDGELVIAGPATVPRVDGALRIAARSADIPLGVAEANLQWDGREAQLHAFFASPARDSVTISGSVPWTASFAPAPDATPTPSTIAPSAVNLRMRARRFPLAALAPFLPPEAVSNLQGLLHVDLRLSGRADQLHGEGRIDLTDAGIELPALGVTYRDVQLDGVLSGNRLNFGPGRVRSGKGELTWTGEIFLAELTRLEPNLSVKFGDFLFTDTPELRLLASGELRLTGSLRSPVATGEVTASSCTVFITEAALEGAGPDSDVVLTPEDIRMLEDTFGMQKKKSDASLRRVYAAADLDLRISLGRDNWVRKRNHPRLAMEVTGEVDVRKPAHGELELRGHVEPVPGRGYIEQFGRTFDFTGGEVLLNGPMQEHTIDIRTEYKVRARGTSEDPEIVVHLDVQSSADEMRLVLSSEPSMSETEIISYITTGRTPTKPGEGSNAAALAADIGLSQVTGVLEDVVQEKVGLDVLQVRYDALQGATLVAGRYLNQEVYVGVRQPLQYRDTGLNSSQSAFQTTVEIEYEAFRWLVLNLQGEASLLRSFLRASHAY